MRWQRGKICLLLSLLMMVVGLLEATPSALLPSTNTFRPAASSSSSGSRSSSRTNIGQQATGGVRRRLSLAHAGDHHVHLLGRFTTTKTSTPPSAGVPLLGLRGGASCAGSARDLGSIFAWFENFQLEADAMIIALFILYFGYKILVSKTAVSLAPSPSSSPRTRASTINANTQRKAATSQDPISKQYLDDSKRNQKVRENLNFLATLG